MVQVLPWPTGTFLEYLPMKFKSIGSVLPSFQKLLSRGELGRQEKVLEKYILKAGVLIKVDIQLCVRNRIWSPRQDGCSGVLTGQAKRGTLIARTDRYQVFFRKMAALAHLPQIQFTNINFEWNGR